MEDDRQNGAVVARPPGTSDTCGTIVNHGTAAGTSGSDRAAAPQPPPPPHHAFRFNLAPRAAAPATVVATPVRGAAPPYGVHLNINNNNPVIKGQHQPKVHTLNDVNATLRNAINDGFSTRRHASVPSAHRRLRGGFFSSAVVTVLIAVVIIPYIFPFYSRRIRLSFFNRRFVFLFNSFRSRRGSNPNALHRITV